jgi:hypothetical protein
MRVCGTAMTSAESINALKLLYLRDPSARAVIPDDEEDGDNSWWA